MRTTVEVRGILFDPRHTELMTACISEMVTRVGAYATEAVHHNLDRSIKHPTPYYETQISLSRTQVHGYTTETTVTDRGVIYGPWLEGISSRNQSSRFKGYAAFRRAGDKTEQVVPDLTDPILQRYIDRMNG